MFVLLIHGLLFIESNPYMYWYLPNMLINPIFVVAILLLLVIGDYFMERFVKNYMPEVSQPITFISERRSITLAPDEIRYVESNDTTVWVHATDGRVFRNRTPISVWSDMLGDSFIRIHRSYLVHLSACTALEGDVLLVDEERLPVSRKYKPEVQEKMAGRG